MAGATNKQFKKAGFKAAGIQKIRSGQGGALTIRSAMKVADRVGVATPAKAVQKYGTGSDAPAGWKDAASGKRRQAEDGAKRLADYRSAAEGHQRASDEGKRANRTAIREQMKRLGDLSRDVANSGSGSAEGAAYRDARAALSGMLRTRDGIAKARKAERTPGQTDLFGVQQPKRAESPFERRVALRNARLAAAGEQAKRIAPNIAAAMKAARDIRRAKASNAAPSFDKSLGNFKATTEKAFSDYWQRQGFKNQPVPRLEFADGQRFVKVIRNDGASKSVHSFIDKTTGDIYKAASWKAPAKGVRGNIHRGEFGLGSAGEVRYAASYEKRRG